MKKILIITRCSDCPYFDNEYYDYSETCTKLDKKNENSDNCILEDCPLENAEEG